MTIQTSAFSVVLLVMCATMGYAQEAGEAPQGPPESSVQAGSHEQTGSPFQPLLQAPQTSTDSAGATALSAPPARQYWPKSHVQKQQEAVMRELRARQSGRRSYADTTARVNQSFQGDAARRQNQAARVGRSRSTNRRNRTYVTPTYRPQFYLRDPYYAPYFNTPYGTGSYFGYPIYGRLNVTRTPILDGRIRTGDSNYFGPPHASQYFGPPHASQAVPR